MIVFCILQDSLIAYIKCCTYYAVIVTAMAASFISISVKGSGSVPSLCHSPVKSGTKMAFPVGMGKCPFFFSSKYIR